MPNPDDFEKLEEEAQRLAEQFPTVTAALLWVISVVDEHHHKLELLRDAIFHIGNVPPLQKNDPVDLQNMMSFIQQMAEAAPESNPDQGEEEEEGEASIEDLAFIKPKKDDDDPIIH